MSAGRKRRTANLPQSFCPNCLYKLDRATDLMDSKATPKPGDFTLCLQCAAIMVFDDELRPVNPDPAKLARDIEKNPKAAEKIRRGQRAIRRLWVEHPRSPETQH